MRKLPLFFLILIASSSVILLAVAQYGEDSTSLGQFVDEFTSSDNISVTFQVIRNSTHNAIELNFTGGATPIDENYTLYTEVDANNRFAITDEAIVISSLSNHDRDHYVYFDYGVGYFTDFTHDLDARGRDDSGITGNDRMWIWLLANATDESIDLINAGEELIGIYFTEFDVSDPNPPEITLREYENTVLFIDKYEPASRNVWYYFRIIKSGTDLKVGIYSTAGLRDAGDATDGDFDNLNITLHNDYNFRYIYAVAGLNSGTPTIRLHSGDIQNLTIGRTISGYATSGYFTTTDYLDEVNGSTLALMTQSRIFPNTHITVQVSDDNATWGDAEGIPGDSYDLVGGLETIDLRPWNESSSVFVMYNLTTSNPNVTPYLNQSRLITTEGSGTVTPGQNVTSVWEYFNASAIGVVVGTHDGGNLTDILVVDGLTFNCSEIAGAPGYWVSVNFTGVPLNARCLWMTTYLYYDGANNHVIDIDLWNHTSSAWVEFGEYTDMTGFEWRNVSSYDLRYPVTDFVDSSGDVLARFYHTANGNINDDVFIDYVGLIAEIPSTVTPSVGGDVDITPWIAIAIILSIIAYLLARLR